MIAPVIPMPTAHRLIAKNAVKSFVPIFMFLSIRILLEK